MPSKEKPTAVRLGEERRGRVDAYAVARGVSQHAGILELIDLGLEVEERHLPRVAGRGSSKREVAPVMKPPNSIEVVRPPPAVNRRISAEEFRAATKNVQVGSVAPAPGSLLKGPKGGRK